jgi:dTDP-4-dehydrorhamnose reductase
MKVLVIGASGFIGSHVYSHALAAGHQVLGTRCAKQRNGLAPFDLARDRLADLAHGFLETSDRKVCVVCAAISQIDRCYREREVTRVVNVVGTCRLLDDLAAHGVKPVFLSTGSVYDGTVGYYDESPPWCPMNEYGRQKAAVEAHIRERVPAAAVLRLDKVVGDHPAEKHLFSEWHAALSAGRPLVCIRGQIFSPTLVDDVARTAVLAASLDLKGVYNVANPEFFSREELAAQFALAMGAKTEIVSKPQAEFQFAELRPLKSYLDATKLILATGMRFTSVREMFQRFQDHLRERGA